MKMEEGVSSVTPERAGWICNESKRTARETILRYPKVPCSQLLERNIDARAAGVDRQ
jgi:hypothetical protein